MRNWCRCSCASRPQPKQISAARHGAWTTCSVQKMWPTHIQLVVTICHQTREQKNALYGNIWNPRNLAINHLITRRIERKATSYICILCSWTHLFRLQNYVHAASIPVSQPVTSSRGNGGSSPLLHKQTTTLENSNHLFLFCVQLANFSGRQPSSMPMLVGPVFANAARCGLWFSLPLSRSCVARKSIRSKR